MEKEVIKIKSGEAIELDINGKILHIESEEVEQKESPMEEPVNLLTDAIKDLLPLIKGETGDRGADGLDGHDGRDGRDGVDGKDGESIKGDTGEAGKDGKDGVDGKDGINGVDGKDGKDGRDGKNGKNGYDGASGGAGASAYQIAVALGFQGTVQEWMDSIGAQTLDELTDVSIVSPTNGQALIFETATGLWKNQDQGGAGTFVEGEVPIGTINSINLNFSLSNTPAINRDKLYLNGIRQKKSIDYTLSSNIITFISAPISGDILLADYNY